MERDAIDFSSGRVSRLFRKLFFPTLMGMLSWSAVTVADGIFVGHGVGSNGIAAINICAPLFMIFTGIGLLFGAGCSVVASVHVSKGNIKAARLNITQAMAAATLIALLLCVVILSAPSAVARLFGSSQTLMPLVLEYMIVLMPGLLFQIWESVAMFVIRLDGSPKYAMWCCVVPAALNFILDWIFIFPLNMGLFGASLASTICMALGGVMTMVYLLFFARSLKMCSLKLTRKSMMLSLRNIGYQCRIGSSGLLGEATMAMLMLVGNLTFMHYLGDDGVGAFGVACYYMPFIFMVGNAIAQSAQPIISYSYGRGDLVRVKEGVRISLSTALVCGLIATFVFMLFPSLLVDFFIEDDGAAVIAKKGFPYIALGFVFFIANIAVIGYYQSLEKTLPATIFALLRGCIFLVAGFLIMPYLFGAVGIWLALPFAEVATTVAIVLYSLVWRE